MTEQSASDASIDTSTALIEAELGAQFDRVRLIARGGAAIVVSAVQRSVGRIVAVKVMRSHMDLEPNTARRELAAHAELSWHPNIATLYDAGVTPSGRLWLCMEHAPATLDGRLKRAPMRDAELLTMARELASAMHAMHSRSIIHCDLKPSNILLADDGSVRVADFGIAQLLEFTPPTLDGTFGTIQYAPPEVLEGARPTTASDVWGFGTTLWAAAHGHAPFGDSDHSLAAVIGQINEGLPPWNPPDGGHSPESKRLGEIVELCTRTDPHARPSAGEIVGLLARPIVVAPRPTVVVRPLRERSRLRAVVAVIAVLATASIAFAVRDDGRGRAGLLNATPEEWCDAVASSDQSIGVALDRAVTTLVDGGRTAEAMRAALLSLTPDISRATAPWRRLLAMEPRFKKLAPELSETRMRDLIVAETATYLATARFIGVGASGVADLRLDGLPPEIARSARAFGEVSEQSRTLCASDGATWRDGQRRLADEVRLSLEGTASPFFSDPTAATALDTPLLRTVATVQPDYFMRLVRDHPTWLLAVTDPKTGSQAVIDMLLAEGAPAFRQIALASPVIAEYLTGHNRELAAELVKTLPADEQLEFYDRLSAAAR